MKSFEVTVGARWTVTGLEDGERGIYRVRKSDPVVAAAPGDGAYPHAAAGFLCFEGNVVTGMLKRAFFDREGARALVEAIATRLIGDLQTAQTIDLVTSELRLIESGEESLCVSVDGDEDTGFWIRSG